MPNDRTFSADDKLIIRRFFNFELQLADGSTIQMGKYLFEVLPCVMKKHEEHQKSQMLDCMQLLQYSMQRFEDRDSQEMEAIGHLLWEDGSMERYWGDLKGIYDRIDKIPQRYLLPSTNRYADDDIYIGLDTTIRLRYQGALLAEYYRLGTEDLLGIVSKIQEGNSVCVGTESMILTESMLKFSFLDVLFSARKGVNLDSSLDEELLEDLEGFDDPALKPQREICDRLSEYWSIDDGVCPADPRAFQEKFRQFVRDIKAMLAPQQSLRQIL
jgi:hypothetical protein